MIHNIGNVDDHKKCRATASLSRFQTDPATFTKKKITLGGALIMVWNRIVVLDEKEDVYIRLIEELSSAYNSCATGHISRVVSVLTGYYDDIKQFEGFDRQLEDNIMALNMAFESIKNKLFGTNQSPPGYEVEEAPPPAYSAALGRIVLVNDSQGLNGSNQNFWTEDRKVAVAGATTFTVVIALVAAGALCILTLPPMIAIPLVGVLVIAIISTYVGFGCYLGHLRKIGEAESQD